jgi:hypothetical protein
VTTFISATCPSCGGSLQVPSDRDEVKCMYCGGNIVVRDAVQLASGVNVANLMELAKAASTANNAREAYDYYTKALEYDPTNASAWLGKGEAAGWMSTLNDIKLLEMTAGFDNAIKYTKDSDKSALREQCAETINRVTIALYGMARKHVVKFVRLDHTWQTYLNQCTLMRAALEVGNAYNPNNKTIIENIIHLCKDNIEGITYVGFDKISRAVFLSPDYEAAIRSKLKAYTAKMQALDPKFVEPTAQRAKAGACFVVTATMGDSSNPAVIQLTRFRNEWLCRHRSGRLFVSVYYAIGPYLAKAVYKCSLLRRMSYLLIVRPAVRISEYFLRNA